MNSFQVGIGGASERVEQARSLARWKSSEALPPRRHGIGKKVTQRYEVCDLTVERVESLTCHVRDPLAGCAARGTFLKEVGQFSEGKAHAKGALDRPYLVQCFGRIEPVSAFCAESFWEKAQFFVVTECIGTEAREARYFTGLEVGRHYEISINPRMHSRVKRQPDIYSAL
jgi:hypothetical protein